MGIRKRKVGDYSNTKEQIAEYLKITNLDYAKLIQEAKKKKVDVSFLLGFNSVIVTYKDKSKKPFDLDNWFIFRDGIIENIYDKGLCELQFNP